MIELKPKAQFQQNEVVKKELAKVVTSDNFKFALSFALAEYVSASSPDAGQLAAVRTFIGVLLNLPLEEPPLRNFQTKTLDYSPPLALTTHHSRPTQPQ